jgi:hypothetical protein
LWCNHLFAVHDSIAGYGFLRTKELAKINQSVVFFSFIFRGGAKFRISGVLQEHHAAGRGGSNKRRTTKFVPAFNGVYTNSFLVVCFIAAWHDYYQKLVLCLCGAAPRGRRRSAEGS